MNYFSSPKVCLSRKPTIRFRRSTVLFPDRFAFLCVSFLTSDTLVSPVVISDAAHLGFRFFFDTDAVLAQGPEVPRKSW